MTQRAGRWSLDNKKSESACSALTGVRRSGEAASLQPHSQSGLHPEELGACNWTKKSGSACLEPTGLRQFAEAAFLQPHRQADLRPRGSRRWSLDKKKSGSAQKQMLT